MASTKKPHLLSYISAEDWKDSIQLFHWPAHELVEYLLMLFVTLTNIITSLQTCEDLVQICTQHPPFSNWSSSGEVVSV